MISMKLLIVVTVILCYVNVIHGGPEAGHHRLDYQSPFPYYLNSYPGYNYYSPQYYVPNYYGSGYPISLGIASHPYGGLSYVEQHGIGKRSADPGYKRPSAFSSQHVSFNSYPYSSYHIIQRHRRDAQPGAPYIKSYGNSIIRNTPFGSHYKTEYYRPTYFNTQY